MALYNGILVITNYTLEKEHHLVQVDNKTIIMPPTEIMGEVWVACKPLTESGSFVFHATSGAMLNRTNFQYTFTGFKKLSFEEKKKEIERVLRVELAKSPFETLQEASDTFLRVFHRILLNKNIVQWGLLN